MLIFAAALLGGLVYWQLLYAPLRAAANDAERRHAAATADARAIEAAAGQLAATGASVDGERSLRADVSSYAAAAGLTLSRLQPEAGGGLTVWIEPAAPTAVFGFIARLAQERGVEPQRLSVERVGEGQVQAQATFVGGA